MHPTDDAVASSVKILVREKRAPHELQGNVKENTGFWAVMVHRLYQEQHVH